MNSSQHFNVLLFVFPVSLDYWFSSIFCNQYILSVCFLKKGMQRNNAVQKYGSPSNTKMPKKINVNLWGILLFVSWHALKIFGDIFESCKIVIKLNKLMITKSSLSSTYMSQCLFKAFTTITCISCLPWSIMSLRRSNSCDLTLLHIYKANSYIFC